MRLFVAAYPPAEACDDLAARLAGLHVMRAGERGVNTRPARRETWHVTLAFLGDVPDEKAPRAVTALERAAAGPPPTLRLAGGGRFGRGRFTILWVGVDGDRDGLVRLSRSVRRELKRERLPFDDRPFKPHLTIARPGDRIDRAEVEADRADLAAYAGPEWPVSTVELIRSHLGPNPWYERVAGYSLVN
ncbi:RNA 2',3'-cyclic phosphodiesterase [Paractinoplanes rishiriensis]|uniref:RNA 2',3'-cyclic phosphodiesterase n=1 Tax=Paractinoplanes rishiriensis TaxID=1050105 RepID=A0A919MSV3_9ACTN|nr:RNA 2',3'-cyclic phosphodiesterase [Actinoplanes rishiriensis]GIE98601.1 RNA 2',3'-cyclic phosphodiesterase [Actinoplanes rishiriensis]